jgi:DNA-directed RNA polymerase beta' subunit
MGESGKEFKMSDCPVAKIRGIQFGLMSDKEIRDWTNSEIREPDGIG